ncbi:MAG: HAMP domain-containing sensor histidine kinase [Planctomycetota bacterium]
MKLTHKLTALLVAGNCAVLCGYGLLARARELAMFEAAMERETFRAGSTLLAAVEPTWGRAGRDAAVDLIAHASGRQPDRAFRWYPELEALPVRERLAREGRAFVRREGALHTWIRFAPPGEPEGALEVTQAMEEDLAYVRSSTSLLATATLASVVVSGAIAFGVGSALVGRPIQALVARVREVGAGDLAARLDLGRRDELGALADALDRMAADLQAASARASAEAEARRATLNQLRHAERLATVGRLAAGVAHELGTPLNVVLARAKLLERQRGEPERVEAHAAAVREQTQRMTRIIRQLLDFARGGDAEKRRVDLVAVARGVIEALAPLARKRGVAFALEGADAAWAVADPTQIEQVLTNLLMNAAHASPEGERVELRVARVQGDPPPDHDATPGPRWCLEVRDRGPGVPLELQQRIFEPFFTTKDVGEGTGLGLPVAHGIVVEHDGWIELDSAPGEGATFRVLLPCAEEAA